jgi:aspartate/methionine/tyrosine aminotransferase
VAITDDAYFGLFYENETYRESLFSLLADSSERILAIKVDGATKENLVWGFRIGFITFASRSLSSAQYDALVKKAMGAIRSSISNSSRLAQSLLIRAMKSQSYKSQKEEAYNILYERYRKVRSLLDSTSQGEAGQKIVALPFNSGYFMTFHVAGGNAELLRKKLLLDRGIGTISIGDNFLRVAYSSIDLENLEDLYSEIFEVAESL